METTHNVGRVVNFRILHARPNSGPCAEIDDCIESVPTRLFKNRAQGGTVFEIHLMKGEACQRLETLEAPVLQPNIIVAIEVVDADDSMTCRTQEFACFPADKTRSTCNQNLHDTHSSRDARGRHAKNFHKSRGPMQIRACFRVDSQARAGGNLRV